MSQLTALPPEVLVTIFCFLDFQDIFACRVAHSTFNRLVQDYQVLEYQVQQQINDVEDNPWVKLPASDKLHRLKRLQRGWQNLDIGFTTEIPFSHDTSGLYDLTGGMYFSGNTNRTTLYYCALPTEQDERPTWKCLPVEEGRIIIDFGLSIYEHDMIVVLTRRKSATNPGSWILELQILELSTHKPHPRAKQPILAVYETTWTQFAVYIEIVGDNLFLVVHHAVDFSVPSDRLFTYNWKDGKLKMSVEAPYCTCYGLVPLSEDKLMIANATRHTLDLWQVPSSIEDQLSQPYRSLALPTFSPDWFLRSLSCRGEPNPASQLPFSPLPFNSNPDNALVLLYLSLQSAFQPSKFAFITHRRSLLDLFPSEPDSPVDTSDMEDDLLNSSGLEPSPTPWAHWGPDRTRVVQLSNTQTNLITVSAGERFINAVSVTGDLQYLEIFDFNPIRVKQRDAYIGENLEADIEVVREATQIPPGNGFSEDVVTSLPYTVVDTVGLPNFRRVLMDEERILGFKTDPDSDDIRVRSIQVLYMGGSGSTS